MSSSIKDWQPKFAEDEALSKSANEDTKAGNDNVALVQKVVNNSIFLGGVISNDLVRSFSWYLKEGSRGVVKEASLLLESPLIAIFKKGAGTKFNISEYNKGKPEAEQIKAEEFGDCIGIKLTEQNSKALEKWYNSFGLRESLMAYFSSSQLSI